MFWQSILFDNFQTHGSGGSRISRRGGGRRPRREGVVDSRVGYVSKILYVETKESGPLGGVPSAAPPLDPPMHGMFTSPRIMSTLLRLNTSHCFLNCSCTTALPCLDMYAGVYEFPEIYNV